MTASFSAVARSVAGVLTARSAPQIAASTAVLVVSLSAAAMAAVIFALRAGSIWMDLDAEEILATRYPLTIDTVLTPFHEHLNAVPILLWSVLPGDDAKLAALLVAHVALATVTAAFLVTRLGPVPGLALSLPLGVLGSAHYDLLVPWQILFTIPLIAGVIVAWLAIPRERRWRRRLATVVLTIIAVASSNAGVFVVFALGLWMVLERRVRQVPELVPAALAWILWFRIYGLRGIVDDQITASWNAIPYTMAGLANGLGGVAGLPWPGGLAVLAAVTGYVVVRRPKIHPALVSFAVALTVMFFVLSFFRWQDLDQVRVSRYIYIEAFMLAIAVGLAAPRLPASWPLLGGSLAAAVLNLRLLLAALPGQQHF